MTPTELHHHLTRAGKTPDQFGALIGYSGRHVRRYLTGEHEIPLLVAEKAAGLRSEK